MKNVIDRIKLYICFMYSLTVYLTMQYILQLHVQFQVAGWSASNKFKQL